MCGEHLHAQHARHERRKCPNHNRYNYKLLRWFLAELGVFGVFQQLF